MSKFVLPLMDDPFSEGDMEELVKFLSQRPVPQITNGPKVREFEEKFSEWLGVKHSLMVNSGSAANQLTMLALKELYGEGEVIVPPLTWVSDIASVLQSGMTPIFVDINMKNLSFDLEKLKLAVTEKTKAVFITHVLGFNALTDELVSFCQERGIKIIEDACESTGATFKGRKVGSIGFACSRCGPTG